MLFQLWTTVQCSTEYFDRRYFDHTHRQLVDGIMQVKDFSLDSIGLTKNWIEFGHPRTATTAQYMILNAFGWVLCGYNNVVAGFTKDKWIGTKMANATMYEGKMLSVTKTHTAPTVMQAYRSGQPISVFSTSGGRGSGARVDDLPGVNVTYIQNFKTMSAPGGLTEVLHDYANIFHLNEAPAEVVQGVQKWLDLWDITRICCGAQMSKTWRAVLHGVNPGAGLESLPAGKHACQQHDFIEIERNLTAIEKPLYGEVLTKVGSCRCSIELTIKDKLNFNARSYAPCKGPLDRLIELDAHVKF